MQHAIEEAHGAAGDDGERNREQAQGIGRYVIGDEKAHHHRRQGDDAFDREIDAAHQDDESGSHAQHERDSGGIEQADEIAKSEEIAVEQADEDAQRQEHRDRRPFRQCASARLS